MAAIAAIIAPLVHVFTYRGDYHLLMIDSLDNEGKELFS